MHFALAQVRQESSVAIEGDVKAFFEEFFGLRSWGTKGEDSQRANFGKDAVEKRERGVAKTRFAVIPSPLLFIAGARDIVEKFLARNSGQVLLDIILLEFPGNSCGFGNERADGVPVGVDNARLVLEN